MTQAANKAKSGGSRKLGRNQTKCKSYALSQKRYKNKIRRARKCVANMPRDKQNKILAAIKIHRNDFERRHGAVV